jgi:hypothetical protein
VTRGTVLLDTNVFTAWLKPRSTLVPLYGKHAAAAIRWRLPLVAHDAVYVGCPGIELVTELSL